MRKLMLLAAMVALALVAATPAVAQGIGQGFGQDDIASGEVNPQVGISTSPGSPEAQAPAPQAPAPQAPAPAQAQVNPKATAEPGKAEAKAGKAEAKAQLPKTGGVAGVTSLVGLGAVALLVAGGLIARRIIR